MANLCEVMDIHHSVLIKMIESYLGQRMGRRGRRRR